MGNDSEGLRNVKYINGGQTYVVRSDDDIINIDSTLGATTIILPALANGQFISRKIYINDTGGDASTNNITLQVNPYSVNLINGSPSIILDADQISAEILIANYNEYIANLSSDNSTPVSPAAWGSILTGTGVASQTDLVTYLNGNYLQLAGGVVKDGLGVNSVDTINRNLYDGFGVISIAFQNRIMNDVNGATSIDYKLRRLYDSTGLLGLDYQTFTLHATGGIQSVDWFQRQLKNSLGNTVLSWSGTISDILINGSGNTSATSALELQDSFNVALLSVLNNGSVLIGRSDLPIGTRFNIKGEGSTNTTYPLYIVNASNRELFQVLDGGTIVFGDTGGTFDFVNVGSSSGDTYLGINAPIGFDGGVKIYRNSTFKGGIIIEALTGLTQLYGENVMSSINIDNNNNIGFWGFDFQDGEQIIYIKEAITPPTTPPSSGAILWVDATTGSTKIMGRSGTVTDIATA